MTQTLGTPTRTSSAADTQWTKCANCGAFVYHKRLQRNLRVCPECSYHFRLPARERLLQLLDPGTAETVNATVEPTDALRFVDLKPYATRLADARRQTGSLEAAMWGTGSIGGLPIVVAVADFAFMGGSMGSAVGEAITRAAELALSTRTPLLVISASGGARMQEGCVSLMQLAKTSQAVGRLNEEGLLFISLLTDPTYGGVSASFAMLGDLLVSEPGSYIGFAGPKVIEQTIRQKLPDDFQTAGFLLDHGQLDLVEARETLRVSLRKILELHASAGTGGDGLPEVDGTPPITDPEQLEIRDPWEVVQLSRHV